MFAHRAVLAAIALVMPFRMAASINPPVPAYSAAGIVNAASYLASGLAPNTIASIYGVNLSFSTDALSGSNMIGGGLPPQLSGVVVYIGGYSAGLFYVSPSQINLLIPNVLIPGDYPLTLVRDGFAGPTVTITLNLTGPALLADTLGNAIAQHLDGSLVTASAPAIHGEWVVLYAVGLGRTVPDADIYLAARLASPIANRAQFALLLNGVPVAQSAIYYAGITPGCAGLYQINLQIPADAPPTPLIIISIGAAVSAPAIQLPIA